MILKIKNFNRRGQSIVEYATILGIVTFILMAMNPMIKRAIQGTIKTVADQIGFQEKAEQDQVAKTGFLINSITKISSSGQTRSSEFFGHITKIQESEIRTDSNVITDMGVHDNF